MLPGRLTIQNGKLMPSDFTKLCMHIIQASSIIIASCDQTEFVSRQSQGGTHENADIPFTRNNTRVYKYYLLFQKT